MKYLVFSLNVVLMLIITLSSCSKPTENDNEDGNYIDLDLFKYDILSDNGDLVGTLFWSEDTFEDSDVKLEVIVGDTLLAPPSSNGENIALNFPITLQQSNKNNRLYQGLVLRIYSNQDYLFLSDVNPHHSFYKFKNSEFEKVEFDEYTTFNYEENYIEDYIVSIDGSAYTLVADNIISETYDTNELSEEFSKDILIPSNQIVSFPAGSSIACNNNSTLIVKGVLNCNGSTSGIVNVDMFIDVYGAEDEIFSNNITHLNFSNTLTKHIDVFNGNVVLSHVDMSSIAFEEFSEGNISNSVFDRISSKDSKVIVDSSTINESFYMIRTWDSYFELKNSNIPLIQQQIEVENSIFILDNNTINAAVFSTFLYALDSFLDIKYNKIYHYGEFNHNHDGLGIYTNNVATIHHNVIEGFSAGIRIDYHNKVLIYNNTIVNNRTSISGNGHNYFWSIYNNILINEFDSIELFGVETAYINNNCYYIYGNYGNYIDYQSTEIIGNNEVIHLNPEFIGGSYCLPSDSPLIDSGTSELISDVGSFEIFGVTYEIEPNHQLTNFSGFAPDIGAFEYSGN